MDEQVIFQKQVKSGIRDEIKKKLAQFKILSWKIRRGSKEVKDY